MKRNAKKTTSERERRRRIEIGVKSGTRSDAKRKKKTASDAERLVRSAAKKRTESGVKSETKSDARRKKKIVNGRQIKSEKRSRLEKRDVGNLTTGDRMNEKSAKRAQEKRPPVCTRT